MSTVGGLGVFRALRGETMACVRDARMTRPAASITPVPSPCISVCQIDQATGLCGGCLRTLDEIAAWSMLDDDARRAVWKAILQRRAAGRAATGKEGKPK